MTLVDNEFTRSIETRDISPNWESKTLVPHCSERCPSNDGKRCTQIGYRPESICEPAVKLLAQKANTAFRSDDPPEATPLGLADRLEAAELENKQLMALLTEWNKTYQRLPFDFTAARSEMTKTETVIDFINSHSTF